jgi:uncharacterized membrane protein (DUF373 family)
MLDYLRRFERITTLALIVLMALVVALSTIELGWTIVKDISTPPVFFLEIDELLEIFSLFLLVLIGVEMIETLKAYLDEGAIRVQVVIIAAVIAVARKVITLDLKTTGAPALVGIAFILLALAVAHRLLRAARKADLE